MAKIENLIQESLKERLEEVTSKPKRRRIEAKLVASTEDRKQKVLGEIKALDKRAIERGEMKEPLVPVLFLWQIPQKRLTKEEASWYEERGGKVKYLPIQEVKNLHIK
jgi:hypothetical protein